MRKELSNLKIKSSMLSYTQAILRFAYYLHTSVPEQYKELEQSLASRENLLQRNPTRANKVTSLSGPALFVKSWV